VKEGQLGVQLGVIREEDQVKRCGGNEGEESGGKKVD